MDLDDASICRCWFATPPTLKVSNLIGKEGVPWVLCHDRITMRTYKNLKYLYRFAHLSDLGSSFLYLIPLS